MDPRCSALGRRGRRRKCGSVHAGAFILGAVTSEKGWRNFKLVGQEERKGRGGGVTVRGGGSHVGSGR